MATATEYCDVEGGGTWTNNANAWDGDTATFDYATTVTASAQTYGSVGGTPFSAIPDGSTINSILAEVYCYGDGNDYITVALYKPSASGYVATTKTITPDTSAGWDAAGSADLWGTTWSAANDIKQASFGIRLTYTNVTKAGTFYVGSVRITVNYTVPASPTEVYAAEAILDYDAPTEVYAAEAILNYTAPAEVYAAEAILDYEVPPTEVYAAEAILDYTVATEVYAAEAILDYEIAETAPCEVYATEAILDYTAPTEVYAAEAILDYEVPPCEVYAAEAILDYISPAEVYATEAILDYEVPPAEVYAAETILDYTAPAEIYAAEAVLDYDVAETTPCEVYAAEAVLDYNPPSTGGGTSPPFRWPIFVGRKTPEDLRERRTPKKPIRITVEDSVVLADESWADILRFAVPERVYLGDNTWMEKQTTAFDGARLDDTDVTCTYTASEDGVRLSDYPSIFIVQPERRAIIRERSLEKAETITELARRPRASFLRRRLIRAKDPSLTGRIEAEYVRELDKLFVSFKRGAAKILNRRELSDDWDEIDAPDLMDKFNRMIEVTITIPGKGIVKRFTTRAYTVGGLRSSQFLKSAHINAVFSILPADRYALDVLVTRDLSGLKGITDEMSKQIIAEITDGMLRGDSMDEVAKAIDDRIDSIGRARAEVLARTETMTAYNEGSLVQYAKYGITEVEWLAAPGDRTCAECATMDGQRFPIDSRPDCPLHPNCRCVLLPFVPEIPRD